MTDITDAGTKISGTDTDVSPDADVFTPIILHSPHDPVPMALVCRAPRGSTSSYHIARLLMAQKGLHVIVKCQWRSKRPACIRSGMEKQKMALTLRAGPWGYLRPSRPSMACRVQVCQEECVHVRVLTPCLARV